MFENLKYTSVCFLRLFMLPCLATGFAVPGMAQQAPSAVMEVEDAGGTALFRVMDDGRLHVPIGVSSGYVLTTDDQGYATWQAPSAGGGSLKLPYTGETASSAEAFYVRHTAPTGLVISLRSSVASSQGIAVMGRATDPMANATGVYGWTSGVVGRGVIGVNDATTGAGLGVYGISYSPEGVGVSGLGVMKGLRGEATETDDANGSIGVEGVAPAYGVYGRSTGSDLPSNNVGVYGEGTRDDWRYTGTGVYGTGDYGVRGDGADYGLWGTSSNVGVYGTGAAGVSGYSNSPTGSGVLGRGGRHAVRGYTSVEGGYGVHGAATATTGAARVGVGVYGESDAPYGVGVEGDAYYGVLGTGYYGVYGEDRDGGYAGRFNGRVWVGGGTPPATGYSLYVGGRVIIRDVPYGDHRNLQWDPTTGEVHYDVSSSRYKENIRPLRDDFRALLNVAPKRYTMIGRAEAEEIGVIAEEVEAAGLTRLVHYDAEGRPDGVRYEKISLYLLEIVKEQEARIQALEAALAELQQ